jgi:SAM-dependent methyltransferase
LQGGLRTAIKQWKDHRGIIIDSVRGFDVIECETCEFKHIIPLPSPSQLDSVYRQEYYTKEKPLYIERAIEDSDWWNLVYGERYDAFEELLPPDRRSILDVGSGPGFFLLHGKQRGWQTLGLEPSAQAAEYSRGSGLYIIEDFLCDRTAKDLGPFDVVHMSEVLEHIPDPAGMMRLAYDLLNPGGLVCIVVPNDYSPFQQALREGCNYQPWWVAPPHHINYFDFQSLGRLFARTHFEILVREATFPIDLFLLMGDNYVGNDAMGRRCHGKRKALELNLAKSGSKNLRRDLYRKLAEIGVGREAMMIGRS